MPIDLKALKAARMASLTKNSPLAGAVKTGLYRLVVATDCSAVTHDNITGENYRINFEISGRKVDSGLIEVPRNTESDFFEMNMGKLLRIFSSLYVEVDGEDGVELVALIDLLENEDFAEQFDDYKDILLAIGTDALPCKANIVVQAGYAAPNKRAKSAKSKWMNVSRVLDILTSAEADQLEAQLESGEAVLEDCPDYAKKTGQGAMTAAEKAASNAGGAPKVGGIGGGSGGLGSGGPTSFRAPPSP